MIARKSAIFVAAAVALGAARLAIGAGIPPKETPDASGEWREVALGALEVRWPENGLSDDEKAWLEFFLSPDTDIGVHEREVAVMALANLCAGGAQDHLAGGFLFPAYGGTITECQGCNGPKKDLSGNGRLALIFLDAYRATDELVFALAARDILEWMDRDMSLTGEGLASYEDGYGFGSWTNEKVARILGPAEAEAFLSAYGVGTGLEGGLLVRKPAWSPESHTRLTTARMRLLAEDRSLEPRYRSGLASASAHAVTISAFARGGEVLLQPKYKEKAKELAGFLLRHKRADGTLPGTLEEAKPGQPAVPDGSWAVVRALLDLAEATREAKWRDEAILLAEAAWTEDLGEGEGAARALAELARSRDPIVRARWVPKALAALGAMPADGREAERELAEAILEAGGGADGVAQEGGVLAELFLHDAPGATPDPIPFVLVLTVADGLSIGPGVAGPDEAAATTITTVGMKVDELRWPRVLAPEPMVDSARSAYYNGETAVRGELTMPGRGGDARFDIACTPCLGGDCAAPVQLSLVVPREVIPPREDRHAKRFLNPEGSGAKEMVNRLVRIVGGVALLVLGWMLAVRVTRSSRQWLARKVGRPEDGAPRFRIGKRGEAGKGESPPPDGDSGQPG